MGALHERWFEAVSEGDLKEVRRLLSEERLDLNAVRNDDGWTALHYAAFRDRLEMARFLVEAGADPTLVASCSSPFETAAAHGARSVAAYLFELQTRGVPDYFGTHLHAAATLGLTELMRGELERGADANALDYLDHAPLHLVFGATQGWKRRARLILGQEDDEIWRENELGLESLERESERFRSTPEPLAELLRQLDLLLAHGADPNLDTAAGFSPLMLAAGKGIPEAVRRLHEAGGDLVATRYGRNLLHIAAHGFPSHEGHAELVDWLCAHGVPLDPSSDGNRRTPLHEAAWMGHRAVAERLVAHGSDRTVRDEHGRTAADEARRRAEVEAEQRSFLDLALWLESA